MDHIAMIMLHICAAAIALLIAVRAQTVSYCVQGLASVPAIPQGTVSLYLWHNKLTTVPNLSTVGNTLRELYIYRNLITSIPPHVFE